MSLGNMADINPIIKAAQKVAKGPAIRTWTTEFCWASSPPQPGAAPLGVLVRWIPESMYRMWQNGITTMIWFQLYDLSIDYHCGLYDYSKDPGGEKAKASLAAFRFPFVAYPKAAGKTLVWGRTPTSKAAAVAIETQRAGHWKRAATVQADANGMFQALLPLGVWDHARARLGTATTPSFAAKAPPEPKITALF
jgi:hypothetical protein